MTASGGREPLSYYHPTGPAGQVFEYFSDPTSGVHDVGLIGLGAGGLAAYNQPSQTFTFYEIDPVVIDIANDPALFTFLKDAPGAIEVVEGDGRLEMAMAPDGSYDVIVLDAFSSDAIPAHIVTREAFELYLSKLRPGGVILANVSNAYLDVRSVVTASALANGMTGFARDDGDLAGIPEGDKEVSSWVALSRDPDALAFLAEDDRWTPVEDLGPGALWTDDFSDILSVIR
jgi:spermidine synthase